MRRGGVPIHAPVSLGCAVSQFSADATEEQRLVRHFQVSGKIFQRELGHLQRAHHQCSAGAKNRQILSRSGNKGQVPPPLFSAQQSSYIFSGQCLSMQIKCQRAGVFRLAFQWFSDGAAERHRGVLKLRRNAIQNQGSICKLRVSRGEQQAAIYRCCPGFKSHCGAV